MVLVKKKDVSFYMLKITQEGHKKLVIDVASRDGKNTRDFFAKKLKHNTHRNKFTYLKCTAQFSQTEYI